MSSPQPADKSAVRARIRAARRELRDDPGHDRAALAERYRDHLLRWLGGRRPGTITAYESWASEPPTQALLTGLQDAGWRVLVPDTLPDLRLSWHDVADPQVDLGIDAVAQADLLLIPALAVDLAGYRLGQGGGCYDRTLPLRRAGAPVVAMIFEHELVDAVPREAHDLPVDAVLTGAGVAERDPATGNILLADN